MSPLVLPTASAWSGMLWFTGLCEDVTTTVFDFVAWFQFNTPCFISQCHQLCEAHSLFFFISFIADGGSAALYSKQENELFAMNCDIDGMWSYSCLRAALTNNEDWCVCNCMWIASVLVSLSGNMENQVEMEEKTRLINQVLELQHTLEGDISLTHTLFFTPGEK